MLTKIQDKKSIFGAWNNDSEDYGKDGDSDVGGEDSEDGEVGDDSDGGDGHNGKCDSLRKRPNSLNHFEKCMAQ